MPGKFSYVDIVEATAVHVEPVGKESRWNVDGELLETNHVNAQVRGLLDWAEHDLLYSLPGQVALLLHPYMGRIPARLSYCMGCVEKGREVQVLPGHAVRLLHPLLPGLLSALYVC